METLCIGFFVVAYWKRWKALKTEPQSVQNVGSELQQLWSDVYITRKPNHFGSSVEVTVYALADLRYSGWFNLVAAFSINRSTV